MVFYWNEDEERALTLINDKKDEIYSIVQNANNKEMQKFFKNHTFLLKILRDEEIEIFKLRYGLVNNKFYTLREIGDKFSITHERVRQKLVNILKKMRCSIKLRLAAVFSDDMLEEYGSNLSINEIEIMFNKVINSCRNEKLNLPFDKSDRYREIFEILLKTPISYLNHDLDNTKIDCFLSIQESKIKEYKSTVLYDVIKQLGLHFKFEFKYEKDWIVACCEGLARVGENKICRILDVEELNISSFRNFQEIMSTQIENMDLPTRAKDGLHRVGVFTIEDLVSLSNYELSNVQNIGLLTRGIILNHLSLFNLDVRPDKLDKIEWRFELAKRFGIYRRDDKISCNLSHDPLACPIEDLGFSVRTYNCLKRNKLNYLSEIIKLNDKQLMQMRGFGLFCLNEVESKVQKYGCNIQKEDKNQSTNKQCDSSNDQEFVLSE